jgi:fructose-bisphosphate aldolase, class I
MTDKRQELEETARAMVAEDQGILAADESTGTMTKRLEGVGVESNEDNRRTFRELLVTTPDAGEKISGVILYDETIKQKTADGKPFPEMLNEVGILPGIKVDTGAKPLAGGAEAEQVTEGLDGLRERFEEYKELGAKFAKWRGVIHIGDGKPTDYAIHVNAHALARYAALAQEAGIVPIVEPEILMDGDHSIDTAEEVTRKVLTAVFRELELQRIHLPGMVLKPNMVLAGYEVSDQPSVEEVAERTVNLFKEVVPADVPGIAFLSGGQTDEKAAAHLNAMQKLGDLPWELTFSYGRALIGSPLKVWSGDADKVQKAQEAFAHRARCNAAARQGEYSEEMEKELVA